MAAIEYGPKSVSTKANRFLEVTRFSGNQLSTFETQVAPVTAQNPRVERWQLVSKLGLSAKAADRLNLALDVLNQLSVLGKSGPDVRQVVVKNYLDERVSQGQGIARPHQFYEIDWVNAPEEVALKAPAPAEPQVIYPFKTAAQREAELPPHVVEARRQAERRRARRKREEEQAQADEERRTEIEAVMDVIFDRIPEGIDFAIQNGTLKIENNEEGQAQVYFRKYTHEEFALVDRESGEFTNPRYNWTESIRSNYLPYINFLAEQSEGKEVTYEGPSQMPPKFYEDVYERAVKLYILTSRQHPEKGLVFYFKDMTRMFAIIVEHREIDLENNTLGEARFDNTPHHLNPHFTEFLKSKRAQLETTQS